MSLTELDFEFVRVFLAPPNSGSEKKLDIAVPKKSLPRERQPGTIDHPNAQQDFRPLYVDGCRSSSDG